MDNSQVFVNRTLNLKKIKYIGLDMDHTLIRYNTEKFEGLAYELMLEKLVRIFEYPQSVKKLKFDFKRAIRGLVIDKARGNILKLSGHGAIRSSYHGLDLIDYKQQNSLYGSSTYVDLTDSNFDAIDTSFSISFATLFAQIVDLKDKKEHLNLPDYQTIAFHLNQVLDLSHRDGSLKGQIAKNLDDYVIKDQSLIERIEKFKLHNKKIVLITNSGYPYTKLLLDYAVNPFLKNHKNWSELFELTITSAQKPRFFYDNLKFLKINPKDGTMTNVDGPLTPGIYQGGCAETFTKDLDLNPEEILYIGDHIYGDVVRLKKDCAWRTALVVEELDDEIEYAKFASKFNVKINNLMNQKIPLENKLNQLMSEKIEENKADHNDEINEIKEKIIKIDQTIAPLIKDRRKGFNPHWGEIMRTGIEPSFFASQVERYACIYFARLADFFNLSPRSYLRSEYKRLAHEKNIELA